MRKLVLVLGLLGACSDDSGGPIEIDDLQDAIIDAYCNLYVQCGVVEDLATCRSLRLTDANDNDIVAAVHAGKVVYNPDRAAECIGRFQTTCDVAQQNEERSLPVACDEMFTGTIAEGGTCALDEECVSQNCDVPSCPDQCCMGACVGAAPPVRPHAGESCADNSSCIDSFCDGTTRICTAYLADGAACERSENCDSGFCLSNVCSPRAAPGQACSMTAPCRDLGDTCSSTTMTCTPYGLTGDACAADNDCAPIYNCDAATSTCVLGARLGDPCGVGNICIDRSYCEPTTMTCTARKPDGQACTASAQCQSGRCDTGATNLCVTDPICI
ncbi:MAG: hypothetical protein HOV81_18255 [Kofleriaceae bacterium]|nr:hypothetical protein [Kofleriaceae bacterium]